MPTNDLTYERLNELVRRFPPVGPSLFDYLNAPPRFIGMDVYELPPEPAKVEVRDIKLSDGTSILSPEFRAETNAWLLERFGRRETYKHAAYMFGNSIVMSPKHAAMLINAT